MAKQRKHVKQKPANDDIKLHYYMVAFLDILGQQEELQKIVKLPDMDNDKETAEFIELLKKTMGVVNNFYETFDGFLKGFKKERIRARELGIPREKWGVFAETQKNNVKHLRFSDGIVIYIPLMSDINKHPTGDIFSAIAACASIFTISMAKGYAIRGGMDIGIGAELNKKGGDLYGPVVQQAYNLESKIAQYPRIVIGDTMVEYLRTHSAMDAIDDYGLIIKQSATTCLDILTIDDDGKIIIDYLGDGFKKYVAKEMNYEYVVKKAYEFVIEQSNKWKIEKNSTLAFRYTLLRNYFDSRLHNWIDDSHGEGES